MPGKKFSQVTLVRSIFTLTVILLVLMSFVLFKRMSRQVTATEQANRTNQIKLYLGQILSQVQGVEAGHRGFLLTGDSLFLHTFRESKEQIDDDLAILHSLASGHDSHQQIDSLHILIDRRMFLIDSVLQVNSNLTLRDNRTKVQNALMPGRMVMDQIKDRTDRLVQSEMQLLNKEQKLKERYRYGTSFFTLLLIVFAFIVFTLAFIILNRQLRISKAYLQQKQRALEDLEEMNEIYRNAEEVATFGSWQWNLKTNLFKCSDNLFRLYGSQPRQEDISFNRFMSFVVPDDREKLLRDIGLAINGKEAVVTTYRVIRSDNEVRHMRAYGKMRAGSDHIMLGATQDVTEVTEAVAKLKASEAFNRSITELVPNFIYIYDLESKKMLYLNKDVEDMIGYSYQELTAPNFNFFQLFHPDDLQAVAKRQENILRLRDNEMIDFEYRIRHKNGEWKNIFVRTTSFKRDRNGALTQIIGVASDVTDLKKTNEKLSAVNKELKAKNRELEQTNADLSSFNFIASHDLQEPLRKIQTFVSFLEESETTLSETGKFYLQRLQHSAARIRAQIQDLLAYAHATSLGKEWSEVDLNVVLDKVLQSLHHLIEKKQANIQVNKLPVVRGNMIQLQELFEHLLNNSFKYHKPGIPPVISITSETMNNEDGHLAELETGSVYHRISIADEGIGFEQEFAGKIFGVFQRLNTQGENVGSGIGLAICRKIVQYHGGMIKARSALDKGSVFDVYLPAL